MTKEMLQLLLCLPDTKVLLFSFHNRTAVVWWSNVVDVSEVYSEPFQTSIMEFFCETFGKEA